MNSQSFKIIAATEEYLGDVRACARAAYSRYTDLMDREPAPMHADFASQIASGQVYVAMCGASLIGYVVFYAEGDHLHLENVAVFPDYSGKGIGKKLVEYVEQTARDKSLNAVRLYTNTVMTENLAMYPKLGYMETERKIQDGFSRIFFRKAV